MLTKIFGDFGKSFHNKSELHNTVPQNRHGRKKLENCVKKVTKLKILVHFVDCEIKYW
jgi:hypothetical protein